MAAGSADATALVAAIESSLTKINELEQQLAAGAGSDTLLLGDRLDGLRQSLGELHRAGEGCSAEVPEGLLRWVDSGRGPLPHMVHLFQETGMAHDLTELRVGRIKQLRDALVGELLSRPAQIEGKGLGRVSAGGVIPQQQQHKLPQQ